TPAERRRVRRGPGRDQRRSVARTGLLVDATAGERSVAPGTLAPMSFPQHRARRLRRTAALRELVRETDARPSDLIAPLFVKEGLDEPGAISSMPGQSQHTIEWLRKEAAEIRERGVLAFVLFGVPVHKDAEGSEAWKHHGIGQCGVRAL